MHWCGGQGREARAKLEIGDGRDEVSYSSAAPSSHPLLAKMESSAFICCFSILTATAVVSLLIGLSR